MEENPKPSLRDTLGRIADAVEKLSADPEVTIEAGPPLCPSCGAVDPEILLPPQDGGQGKMSEIIVDGQCAECRHNIYIVIESYSCHRQISSASDEIVQRKEGGYFREVQ